MRRGAAPCLRANSMSPSVILRFSNRVCKQFVSVVHYADALALVASLVDRYQSRCSRARECTVSDSLARSDESHYKERETSCEERM